MLARLQEVEGVAEARVDATGRHFALVLAPGADEAATLAAVGAALRHPSRRLSPAQAAAQLARAALHDRWFARAQVAELCYLEARVLAARGEGAVATAAELDPAERGAVGDALREELFEVMDRVLAEGGRDGTGWFHAEWPGIAARVAARCEGRLAPARRERVAAALAALHAR